MERFFFQVHAGLAHGLIDLGAVAPRDGLTHVGDNWRWFCGRVPAPPIREAYPPSRPWPDSSAPIAVTWLVLMAAGAAAGRRRHRRRHRVEQVEQNVKVITWTLSAEELAEIDGITKG